ncbi:MAG: DUF933 domain-containing protein [Candidatus Omnitrophica bacterium]|nr:DUF933 domain-containing protein [Candidatus Omnitrophota bacterium]
MKIGFLGLDLTQGKVKYHDPRLVELEKKFLPQKISSFFVEFTDQRLEAVDVIVCAKSKILDVFIPDMETFERRLKVCEDAGEKALLTRCIQALEQEKPLCDLEFSEGDLGILKRFQLLTTRPTLIEDKDPDDLEGFLRKVFLKAEAIFFYTGGKREVRAWLIKKGSTAVEAAAKIHTDLARGFIKADVVNFNDFASVYNMQEARTKGLVKVVDRDYIVEDGDIIEIKFNV